MSLLKQPVLNVQSQSLMKSNILGTAHFSSIQEHPHPSASVNMTDTSISKLRSSKGSEQQTCMSTVKAFLLANKRTIALQALSFTFGVLMCTVMPSLLIKVSSANDLAIIKATQRYQAWQFESYKFWSWIAQGFSQTVVDQFVFVVFFALFSRD